MQTKDPGISTLTCHRAACAVPVRRLAGFGDGAASAGGGRSGTPGPGPVRATKPVALGDHA